VDQDNEHHTENGQRILNLLVDVSPLVAIFIVFSYFSLYQLPSSGYAATATNAEGLITGNFVWDGDWNTPFLFAGMVIVEAAALRSESRTRAITFGYSIIIFAGAIVADWLVFLTPYVKPLYCINCQVSGMSAVSSASVGTAFAVSSVYLLFSMMDAQQQLREDGADRREIRKGLTTPIILFGASLATLYLFSLSALVGLSHATEFVHLTSLLLGMGFMAGMILFLAKVQNPVVSLAGSKKLFVGVIVFTVVAVALASPVYPIQYQTYRPWGWAGYVAFGSYNGSVSAVTGEWVVPTLNCSANPREAVLFWVGMDGYRSSTVEQGGTRGDCINGVATYSAWHEFWPEQPNTVNFTTLRVAPGNLVSARVAYSAGSFNITVNDISTGQSATFVGAYARGERLDAEWIVEAPGFLNGTRLALPNFGQVQFNDGYATINGYLDSIGLAKNGTVLYYCTGSHYRLVPSVLESGWTAFTVYSLALAGC
jgi:Peptidase A4 family